MTALVRKKVCIALSGGVDSAVAAYILQQQGHDVIAAFIKVWQPDFLPCTQDEDRLAAKRVAASLGIPFHMVDLSDVYKESIVANMVDSYARGETPNPDVMCNKVIKFGALWDWAKSQGCDALATGHHAQVVDGALYRGADPKKDQAYFLWELQSDDLAHVMLPIGHLLKPEVRGIAEQARLPSAARKDSQGLCFLGMLTMSDFLEHFIPHKEGVVVDTTGAVLGTHTGAHQYTLGQRARFVSTQAADTPLYVVSTDSSSNTITVARDSSACAAAAYTLRSVLIRTPDVRITGAEVRYHGDVVPVTSLTPHEGDIYRIEFTARVVVAPGQSVVLYAGDMCIGGGIVNGIA
jgi:tRNA-specific 2-thiouridylase